MDLCSKKTRIANRFMKMLASHQEIQMKATVRFHLTPVRISDYQNSKGQWVLARVR